jgi:hypothetical protein
MSKSVLLETIQLPRDLKKLKTMLPRPNYKRCKENSLPNIPFMGINNFKNKRKFTARNKNNIR